MPRKSQDQRFKGLDLQLYCWIKQHRILCAVHKCMYYELDNPVLEDGQYDYLEKSLIAVEQRHPDISQAVTQDGFMSPSSYPGYIRFPGVLDVAKTVRENLGANTLDWPCMDQGMTDDDLYDRAMLSVKQYPV